MMSTDFPAVVSPLGSAAHYAGGGVVRKGLSWLRDNVPVAGQRSRSALEASRVEELPRAGQPSVIKEKGGNWITFNEDVGPDVVPAGAAQPQFDPLERWAGNFADWHNLEPGSELANWWEKNFRNYMRNDFGTANDPLSDLVVQGRLSLGEDRDGLAHRFAEATRQGKDPRDELTRLIVSEANGMKSLKNMLAQTAEQANFFGADLAVGSPFPPWVSKVLEQKKPIYNFDMHAMDNVLAQDVLGQIQDYARTLPPAQLKNMSAGDMARNAATWHEQLAKKKASGTAEDFLRGTNTTKEYPTGYRWVEVAEDDALNLEGKAMGHCVGSYCDVVKEGNSSIYSLRGPDGKPHVTVEVAPAEFSAEQFRTFFEELPSSVQRAVKEETHKKWRAYPQSRNGENAAYQDAYPRTLSKLHPELSKQFLGSLPREVIQVKGKANAAPVKEYRPYVRDFLLGNKWDAVHETGDPEVFYRKGQLVRVPTAEELLPMFKVSGGEADELRKLWPEFLAEGRGMGHGRMNRLGEILGTDPENITKIGHFAIPLEPPKFAKGGSVKRPRKTTVEDARALYPALEQEFALPEGLLGAVEQVESTGNPDALSGRGAQGLFQLMPKTAARRGVNPWEPVEAARGAAEHLKILKDMFGGDLPHALAGWNWGDGNVKKQGFDKKPKETVDFIEKVMSRLRNVMPSSPEKALGAVQRLTETPFPSPPGRFDYEPLYKAKPEWLAAAEQDEEEEAANTEIAVKLLNSLIDDTPETEIG